MPELVPLTDAANQLGIGRRTLQTWMSKGLLKRYRQYGDRKTYVDLHQVRRLMKPRSV